MATKILIIERGTGKSRNRIYTYVETHAQFAANTTRSPLGRWMDNRVNATIFDKECDALAVLKPAQWTSFIIEV